MTLALILALYQNIFDILHVILKACYICFTLYFSNSFTNDRQTESNAEKNRAEIVEYHHSRAWNISIPMPKGMNVMKNFFMQILGNK